jgi:4-hydroxybenzoate polyprenyltransferase
MDTPRLSTFHGLYRLGRFSALSFSLMLPLLGASTADLPRTAPWRLAGLLAVGLVFHIFAYVLNDVIDLPLDCTEPLRADSPMVLGLVRRSDALVLALVQVPLVFLVHAWLGGGIAAALALLCALGLMAIYDVFGKRIAFPPLSDAVQGLAWAALAAYGTFASGGILTGRSGVLLALVFVYVLMINGVHGGLRDLVNDAHHGARTTALFLGGGGVGLERLAIPRGLLVYALALQGLLLGISLLWLWRYSANESGWAAQGLPASVVACHLLLFVLLRRALAASGKAAFIRAGILHLFLSLGCLFLPFAVFMDHYGAACVVLAYVVPIVVLCLHDGLTWA